MRIALRLDLDPAATEMFAGSQMSPGMLRTYRRIERRFSARPHRTGSAGHVVPKLKARIIMNGRDFDSAQQMPSDYRRFYEEILVRVVPMHRAVQIVTRMEHANSIKRSFALASVAAGCAAVIVYLWLHGYYA